MPRVLSALISCWLAALLLAQQAAPPARQEAAPATVLRAGTEEVLLDFVARDKHQHPVKNLRPEEISVFEDGVRQKLRGFNFRDGRDTTVLSYEPGGAPHERPAATPANLRDLNVVSLVFAGISANSRREASQAAHDFLNTGVRPDTYIGVFTLNQRLAVLQSYTADAGLLHQAVDRVANGVSSQTAKDQNDQVKALNQLGSARNPSGFKSLEPGSAEERSPDAATSHSDAAAAAILLRLAAVQLAMFEQQSGEQTMDALLQLIRAHAQLPGRKTVLYLSEGLIVPPEQAELLRSVISEANRHNVTFYCMDAAGLSTTSATRAAEIASEGIRMANRGSGPAIYQTDTVENLRALAEDTGGFAVTDSNDLRVPLLHVMEDVRAHYEAAYAPESELYDGHFRVLEVKTSRPGVTIQARRGYFALPRLNGETLEAFEMAGLTALDTRPAPGAFEFHAGVFRFDSTATGTDCEAVFTLPSRALHFTEDAKKQTFRIRVSFLGLVKDAQGQVVAKVSRDLPFQAPLSKRAEFERGEVTVSLPLRLPPGLYHLEAAAVDQEAGAASCRRIAIAITAPAIAGGPAERMELSDLVFVRSVAAVNDPRPGDPLDLPGGRITPELNPALSSLSRQGAAVYCILYPTRAGAGVHPRVGIAVFQAGKLVRTAAADVLPGEAGAPLRVMGQIPVEGLGPGQYEVQVTASVGGAKASGTAVMTVE